MKELIDDIYIKEEILDPDCYENASTGLKIVGSFELKQEIDETENFYSCDIKQEVLSEDEALQFNANNCDINYGDIKTEIKEEICSSDEKDSYAGGNCVSPINSTPGPSDFKKISLFKPVVEGTFEINKSFRCTLCKSYFFRERQLKVHIRTMHKDRSDKSEVKREVFLCEFCPKSFSRKCHVTNHMRSKHTGLLRFNCAMCLKAFPNVTLLNEHRSKDHTGVDVKLKAKPPKKKSANCIINCSECDCSVTSVKHLVDHFRIMHNGLKLFKCTACNLRYDKNESLQIHLDKMHKRKTSFSCSKCNKTFKKEQLLIQHKRTAHNEFEIYLCSQCDKGFDQKTKLKSHVRSEHKNFKCPECFELFINQRLVENHLIAVHGNMKRYNCKKCSSYFDNVVTLKLHDKKVHLTGQYKCAKCKINFNDKLTFDTHLAKHKENEFLRRDCPAYNCKRNEIHTLWNRRSFKRFKCAECDSRFALKKNLQLHVGAIHRKERPYKCPHCRRFPFSTPSSLYRHMRLHCDKDNFKCTHCNLTFTDKNILKTHTLMHDIQICKHPTSDKTFDDKLDLLINISQHANILPFFCSHCNVNFESKFSLLQHVRSVYLENKQILYNS